MENTHEFMTEQEILENFDVREEDLEDLLVKDVVTSKIANGRRVFHVEEIKIRMEDNGKKFQKII